MYILETFFAPQQTKGLAKSWAVMIFLGSLS